MSTHRQLTMNLSGPDDITDVPAEVGGRRGPQRRRAGPARSRRPGSGWRR